MARRPYKGLTWLGLARGAGGALTALLLVKCKINQSNKYLPFFLQFQILLISDLNLQHLLPK